MRSLADHTVDVLVLGGGINGTGVARDAARRGLRVALVEKEDFGYGTTGRSTRLIHGGLRYLELFDFSLVRADMRERETLLGIAPHLVFPLPFLLPMYRPSLWYRFKLRIGMLLYDLLSLDKSLPKRKWLDRAATLDAEPNLDPDGLVGAWRFYDAQVPLVERLVIENLIDAEEHGALVLNHATALGYLRDGDRVTGARVRDEIGGREIAVRARMTVNATGPWLDRTMNCVQQSLNDAQLAPRQIDKVVLVGGSTRTPIVARLLEERLGQPTHCEVNPDLALYPTPAAHCSECAFRPPCLALQQGADAEAILAAGYRTARVTAWMLRYDAEATFARLRQIMAASA